jgi:hypothetical protein
MFTNAIAAGRRLGKTLSTYLRLPPAVVTFIEKVERILGRINGPEGVVTGGVRHVRLTKKGRPHGYSFTKKGPGRRALTGPVYEVA